MSACDLTVTVNGEEHSLRVAPHETLLDVLRERLDLTGTKNGCAMGECGACTVLVDGRPVSSCLTLALSVHRRSVTTIEGLAADGVLHPLQQAFLDHGAVECGFCTPGMVLTAKALLDEVPHPTEEQVRQYLRGNLCRCTGYAKVVEAVVAVLGPADEAAPGTDEGGRS